MKKVFKLGILCVLSSLFETLCYYFIVLVASVICSESFYGNDIVLFVAGFIVIAISYFIYRIIIPLFIEFDDYNYKKLFAVLSSVFIIVNIASISSNYIEIDWLWFITFANISIDPYLMFEDFFIGTSGIVAGFGFVFNVILFAFSSFVKPFAICRTLKSAEQMKKRCD